MVIKMNLQECIINRRSIRTFINKKISDEIFNQILDAAILSPSAKNQQPWKFIIVSDEIKSKIADKLTEAIGHPNPSSRAIAECSHLVLVYNTLDDYFSHMSIGAAIENMILTATANNIGSLWIGYIRKVEDFVNAITQEKGELISAIAFGYANENPEARPRKDKSEVVRYLA